MADDHDNDTDVTALLTNDHVDKLRDTLRGTNISITRLESVTRDLIKSHDALIKSHNVLIKSNKERMGELRKSRKRRDLIKSHDALIKSHDALIKSNKERAGLLRKSRKDRRKGKR